jgi:aldose 1-epimerase
VDRESFGTTTDGTPVDMHTLTNANGMQVRLIDYGATITSIRVPDRDGRYADVVLGFDSLAQYETKSPYFGATVGRYANRIANGRFALDGTSYQLPVNNAPNTLHGGPRGFDKRVWHAEPFRTDTTSGVVFTRISADGEEGFPGTMHVVVTYTLTADDALRMEYEAATDRTTIVNMTNHAYFNLVGAGKGDILGHVLQIPSSRFTPVDSTLIPTGEIRSVAGTPLDFRQPTPIGARIDDDYEQLRIAGGYDHNWIIDGAGDSLALAARVYEPTSGRVLEVYTTEPGVQFYTGNFLDGSITGKVEHRYGHRSALTLETQHYPDSPNHPDFPSTVLRPGETYRTQTVYRFSVRKSNGRATRSRRPPVAVRQRRPALVLREDARAAVLAERDHLIVIRHPGHLHPRRSHRHPGNGETRNLRPLAEQPVDVVRRDVSLDHVALHRGGVAGLERLGHAERLLDLLDVRRLGRGDVEAVLAQMLRPLGAAAAAGLLLHVDVRLRQRARQRFAARGDQGGRRAGRVACGLPQPCSPVHRISSCVEDR